MRTSIVRVLPFSAAAIALSAAGTGAVAAPGAARLDQRAAVVEVSQRSGYPIGDFPMRAVWGSGR